ncbi:MAG: hypothetical protein WBS24_05230 [Terriglobales bacterium]
MSTFAHGPNPRWNWIAIFSFAASFAVSLACWTGIIRGVQYLVR